jgi:release factor glutamine methyltransferase
MNQINIEKWVRQAAQQLKKQGIDVPLREARLLLAHALGWTQEQVFFFPTQNLTAEQITQAGSFLSRRLMGEPLSKIKGKREFWGRDFKVTHDTLDPRPDTETLIEAVIELFPDQSQPLSFLDLGTGTGCLIISLLLEYPKAVGVGVDLSEKALDVAASNQQTYLLASRLRLLQSNWFEKVSGTFDVIVSNPPYIGKEEVLDRSVLNFDPHLALFAEEEGLAAYRSIAQSAKAHLTPEGVIVLEIGYTQTESVTQVFEEYGFKRIKVLSDLQKIPRCLVFQ